MTIEGITGSKQFAPDFLQAVLKSMRMAQHFIADSSLLRSNTESQGIGFAALLAKSEQGALTELLAPSNERYTLVAGTPAKEKTASSHVDEFIRSVWPYAQQAAQLLGLDPKILLAQAALETGWGLYVCRDRDGSSSNNLFNIKVTSVANGEAVRVKTTEYIANNAVKVKAAFKKYSSIENSFNDYISLIQNNERYAAALAHTADPEQYINELQRAGYATDPQYAAKILSIYHGAELQQAFIVYNRKTAS